MMKVLFIDPQQLKYDYGLLENMNCDITFCCRDKFDDPGINHIKYKKVFKYHLYNLKILKAFSYLKSLFCIWIFIVVDRPDVVHIQWWRIWLFDYCFLYLIKPFVKTIVFTAHNIVPHDEDASMREKCKKYYEKVDHVIVHAKSSKTVLSDDFGIPESKVHVIKHGLIDIKVNEANVNNIIGKVKLCYNIEGKLVFSLLGNQSKYKGFDIVEEVWLTTPEIKNNDNIRLLVAGKSRNVNLERLNSLNNVIVVNRLLSDEEFMAFVDVSSVILIPYIKISQSGVLLTAINRCVPVLVSNVGGLPEPLEDARIGWNMGEPSIDNLRISLLSIIDKMEDVYSIRRNTRNWSDVKSKYSWKELGIQTQNLYESAILRK